MDKIVKIVFVVALLAQTSTAFPLTAGNGEVSATVYGYSKGDGVVYLDMSASQNEQFVIELIDDKDWAYSAGSSLMGWHGFSTYGGQNRQMVWVKVPKSAGLQRIKVTPKHSDPFMIDWDGVPEAFGDGIGLKFYGGSRSEMHDCDNNHVYMWTFDIKVTNTGNGTLSFETDEILMKDTFGWVYSVENYQIVEKKLLPGESTRFLLNIRKVSEFSRPTELIFRDLVLNAEGWT